MGGQVAKTRTDEELVALVREFMLVNRHYVLGVADSYRGEDRLDRSAFILLSRIEAEGPMSIGQLLASLTRFNQAIEELSGKSWPR